MTDAFDRRLVTAYLENYLHPELLDGFQASGAWMGDGNGSTEGMSKARLQTPTRCRQTPICSLLGSRGGEEGGRQPEGRRGEGRTERGEDMSGL